MGVSGPSRKGWDRANQIPLKMQLFLPDSVDRAVAVTDSQLRAQRMERQRDLASRERFWGILKT
ncbi:hypothetical protein RSSM_06235 [Rhodopirellula sallentina SM41]|uniref:Uncharacterized protein n=1 Tax=Rhodopirellula sallentina SM41 TaxID=1263870 RepID=M5TTF4_9BACT|nr:hypothetical protein RSSM_06235 [Rhodopirellula sallentina SM41]